MSHHDKPYRSEEISPTMSSPCCIHGQRSDTLAHSDALVDANAQLLSPAAHLAKKLDAFALAQLARD